MEGTVQHWITSAKPNVSSLKPYNHAQTQNSNELQP
jgi:hypothetical protein